MAPMGPGPVQQRLLQASGRVSALEQAARSPERFLTGLTTAPPSLLNR